MFSEQYFKLEYGAVRGKLFKLGIDFLNNLANTNDLRYFYSMSPDSSTEFLIPSEEYGDNVFNAVNRSGYESSEKIELPNKSDR